MFTRFLRFSPEAARPSWRWCFWFGLLALWALEARARDGLDTAANYSLSASGPAAWQNNAHRGDRQMGPWILTTTLNGGAAGHFVGDSSLGGGNINTDGKAFGLFANPPLEPVPSAAAIRTFAQPVLRTGDSISFRMSVNYRNGNKGFSLRDANGLEYWNFNTGRNDGVNDGYYIRNGPSGTVRDNGQRFGAYHANTVFTFTFTQRERRIDWTVVRSGGLTATVEGNVPVASGTIEQVRFYITATEAGGLPENNLYFNDFTFAAAPRGDAPLTLGERRMPGREPSYFLRFRDPQAGFVNFRSANDWNTSYGLTNIGDNTWQLDIRTVPDLTPGYHAFRFRMEGGYEPGPERLLYLDPQGRLAKPPAVYLTWQRDPTTTMTVHWHNYAPEQNSLRYRAAGSSGAWTTLAAATRPFPFTERLVHTAEMTGLMPGADYEFEAGGYDEVFRFRTLPASLEGRSEPVRFGVGGDVDIGATADAMTAAISAKNPDFLVVGGDLAYADGRAQNFSRWYRYFESWYHRARTTDGRLIPKITAIGNHEVRYGYTIYHPDFDNTLAWRQRYAPYFYSLFAFPGNQGHGVLDFGDYLSLVILDTDHSTQIVDQVDWLRGVLDVRRNRPHLLPVYHVPAYTSFRPFTDEFSARVRQHWVPLFEQAGVQLAFEHHDHTFSRTKPLLGGVESADGIRYVGDGLWGIGSRPPDTSRSYLETANTRHHVHLVHLTAQGRTVEAVDTSGQFFGGRLEQGVDGVPTAPAPAIQGLAANSLQLSWSAVPRAAKYKVIRSDGRQVETAATNYFDDEWTPASGFTYVIEAINRAGHSQNHPVVAAAPRQVWALSNNLPWDGSGDGDMLADLSGDGRPNLLKYFHGLDPRTPAALEPVVNEGVSADAFSIRYQRNPEATDVRERVWWSTDLAAANWSTNNVIIEPVPDGPGWFRATVPTQPGEPRKFLRLEVTTE